MVGYHGRVTNCLVSWQKPVSVWHHGWVSDCVLFQKGWRFSILFLSWNENVRSCKKARSRKLGPLSPALSSRLKLQTEIWNCAGANCTFLKSFRPNLMGIHSCTQKSTDRTAVSEVFYFGIIQPVQSLFTLVLTLVILKLTAFTKDTVEWPRYHHSSTISFPISTSGRQIP